MALNLQKYARKMLKGVFITLLKHLTQQIKANLSPAGFGQFAHWVRYKSLKTTWFPTDFCLPIEQIVSNHNDPVYGVRI